MLVELIRGIHYAIILAIAIAPFVTWPLYRNTACIFLIYLLLQYITGYERCGLTVMEFLVLGKKYESGFLYRVINPVIKVPEHYFDKYLIGVHLFYIYLLSDSLHF
jgi:hypothetical protein